ncbi:MAG: protoporphyrinogen oxidase [Chloroflexi bacterium]|nr:MAG: protoporphyrinogen oxidase [Chloroflexota bacterium]MCE7858371.1 protoporphyrinogen oxidase [Chloroflexi bacterium CFX2]
MKIVIIGGGIAGLSAAYYAKKNIPEAEITLLESDSRWGGKISTDRVNFDDGTFIIEGGPDTFLATKPYATALCKELGLGDRLHGTNQKQKNTYVLHCNKLEPLPDGLAMMIPTNVQAILKNRLVSWFGKARMGLDFLQPAKAVNGDESLGTFVSRRLGREAYENLIEPLMSGIYAGDGDQLSLASTFPYLRDLELKHGSLARGALKLRAQSNGRAVQGSRSAFLTPTTGLAEIVEALVNYLHDNNVKLRLNTSVSQISKSDARYIVKLEDGSSLEFDSVILATPAYVSGTLLASFDPELASTLQSIPYVSTATISLAYRQSDLPKPLDGYGYVIPRREGRKALAGTWTSTKFPHRAPEGYALIRVFVGRAGQDIPWDKDELLALAKEEVKLTSGITAEPIISRVFMWDKAMPQYNLGHPDILKRIDTALEKYPSLALAGNGYRGIGIPDCIHSGELAVERVLKFAHSNVEAFQPANL